MKTVASTAFFLAFSLEASAYCMEPVRPLVLLPEPPSAFEKPDVPYCLTGYSYSREHTCSEWELSAYFDEVDQYIRKLKDYLDDIERYEQEVTRYALSAVDFAICESEAVKSQHE